MNIGFYIAAAIAIISTIMVITRVNAFNALMYMIISLMSVAIIFYMLGAPFIAALEIIIYAGAIMVLFIFAVMMLNLGEESVDDEKKLLSGKMWICLSIMALILLAEVAYVLWAAEVPGTSATAIGPKKVGMALFGPYIIGVELAAMLLIAGIVGAYHLGKRDKIVHHRFLEGDAK